jgi:lactate dehydrogenase-like 2-hydroxyacid dehydrogenase
MSHKISILANIHLLPETEAKIQEVWHDTLVFPREDTVPTTQELIARTSGADAVLVSPSTPITAQYLAACPTVRYIGVCGTSMESVDQQAVQDGGIMLTNVQDYGDEPTAEFIFMQLVCLARGMDKYQWRDEPTELMGKTIGIIGLGALGQAIAHLALAYKMNVQYVSRTRKPAWEKQGAQFVDKSQLFATSDIVVISTPSNYEAINANDFDLMQPNIVLVQASQGNCFDRSAFSQWVKHNHAILDYAAGEENYQAYKDLPNVMFPKVIAGHTRETRQRVGARVIENLHSYLESAA